MRLITVAIHTYDRAIELKNLLEKEGIEVLLQNVNLEHPTVSSGVRVRIHENNLPLALRIIEHREIFTPMPSPFNEKSHCILVPVDFSDYSVNALEIAFALAQRHNAQIRLLYSFIDPYVAGNMQLSDQLTYEIADNDARQRIEEDAHRHMDEFANVVRSKIKYGELSPVVFDTVVMEGVPEDAIIEYAKANPPYLVVMGTRSYAKKQEQMIGSVSAEVLDKCLFSVLTIPQGIKVNIEATDIRIHFFTNLEQQDLLALDTMSRIFKNISAKVTLVHLPAKRRPFERSNKESLLNVMSFCKKNFPNFEFDTMSINADCAAEQFGCLVKDNPADIIVIPNKRQNAFARLFNPGLAHKMILNADIPMLAIPV